MGRFELTDRCGTPRGPGKGRRGESRTHALLTYREAGEILYRRGVLTSPGEHQVRHYEKRALAKLHQGLLDLEAEFLDDDGHARIPIMEVY